MRKVLKSVHNIRSANAVFLAATALAVSACASTTTTAPKRAPANIEVQEAVGFTITEESKVGNDVRLDYDQAVLFLQQGNHEQGIALLEEVASAAPDLSAPRIDLGVAHHLQGDLQAAEENLLLALEANPDHPVAHNELGIIYRKTGRLAEARRSYEAALAVYPGYHYARRNLAVLCDLYLADLDCARRNYDAYMATVTGDEEASMWIRDLEYRMNQAEGK